MLSRRRFLRTGAAAGVTAATVAAPAAPRAHDRDAALKPGIGISPWSGAQYKSVPTVCTLCPSRCPMLGYVDDGRVVKLEGNPQSIRTHGRLCARGQVGVEQPYDPDRIIHPLKRAGRRGEGRWERIGWDAALAEITAKLKALQDAREPERFMVLHGVLSLGAERMVKDIFMPAFGSASIAGPESLGRSARRVAHQLTWGGAPDHWDIENSRFILNFGSNFLEAHTNHLALARRFARNAVDNRARMITFDVRLSNTAARSDEWIPVKPGTDLAVVLAMCHVIMAEGLHRGEGEEFLEFCKVTANANASVAEKVAALKEHLASYTPEWAEKITGVSADKIKAIAIAFAKAKPACVISHRGATSHYNGVETERAIQMLAAITGNVDNPGGRCQGVVPKWVTPKVEARALKRLSILDGPPGAASLPLDGVGHQALRAAKPGSNPAVLMWIGHNPIYAYGDMKETTSLLSDEALFPYTIAVTPFYDESAAFADLILPDTTALEGFDLEAAVSANQVAEYAIRQPVIDPVGEARDIKDVLGDLAKRLGLRVPVGTGAKLVEEACRLTPEIRAKARGFAGMRRTGIWSDRASAPAFHSYRTAVKGDDLQKDGVILDEATGVYWNWKLAGVVSEDAARANGYSGTKDAGRGYVAQKVKSGVVFGFRPDKISKSGLLELYSERLKTLGKSPLPAYTPIPEHQEMAPDQLVLTTYKVNIHTNSATQNCRFADEIYYENPAWLNPTTAKAHGIKNGDAITITSAIGEMKTTARVTHAVAPWAIAVSTHCGRTAYGRFASGGRSPAGVDDNKLDRAKWWKRAGAHPNGIIPKSSDPISGEQRWMDTVVRVRRMG